MSTSRFAKRAVSILAVAPLAFAILTALFSSPWRAAESAGNQANGRTIIYDDALASGWADWSWGTAVNFTAPQPVHQGDHAIVIRYKGEDAGFYLHHDTPLPTADYDTLNFWIRGHRAGNQAVRLKLIDQNDQITADSVLVELTPGEWQYVTISLSTFSSLSHFKGIVLENAGSIHLLPLALDEIYLSNDPLPETPIATPTTGSNPPTATPPASPTQTPPPSATPPPPSPPPPAPPGDGFLETFDGWPAAPEPFQSGNWDVAVHSRDDDTWYSLEPMDAMHGSDCSPAPAVHPIHTYADTVFRCRDHLMTSLRASGYGVIYLTPNQLVDFSAGEAVIRFDVSTLRLTNRDWFDIWITPYGDNLQAPLEDWLPDLNGEPRRGIHIRMELTEHTPIVSAFGGEVIRNFAAEELPEQESAGYETFLIPSAGDRETFELRISANHVKFGMPDYNFWWVDANFAPIDWNQGIVQIGHHSYNPMKDCPVCLPNTWHWDNVTITPAVPFTMIQANQRFVEAGSNAVQFSTPAPAASHLRFSGIGDNLEVSFNSGATWQPAQMQAQEEYHGDHFRTYWMPIPAGTTSVNFRGDTWYGGGWHARDIAIWSLTPPDGAPQGAWIPAEESPPSLPVSFLNTPAAQLVCDLPAPIQLH
jgi:hypothetical protein